MKIRAESFPPTSASECMRLDEEILSKAEKGETHARIYEWESPSISVPRSFSLDGVNFSVLQDAGIEFVKRPTGGGVLINGFDLSYSIGVPRQGGWGGLGIDEAGLILALPVLETLIKCGFMASFRPLKGADNVPQNSPFDTAQGIAQGEPAARVKPLCATQKSPLDILISGRKVAAFAQRRTAKALFQHGSIYIRRVPERVISSVIKAGLGSDLEWRMADEAVIPLEETGVVDVGRLKELLAVAVAGLQEPK